MKYQMDEAKAEIHKDLELYKEKTNSSQKELENYV